MNVLKHKIFSIYIRFVIGIAVIVALIYHIQSKENILEYNSYISYIRLLLCNYNLVDILKEEKHLIYTFQALSRRLFKIKFHETEYIHSTIKLVSYKFYTLIMKMHIFL